MTATTTRPDESLATVLVPGLLCDPRLYAELLPTLWAFGPVMVADHSRDDSIAAIAERVLRDAPQRFSLVGLSMGGYTAFELMRRAPERVARLVLMNTSARPDTPEQSARRQEQVRRAQAGEFEAVVEGMYPALVSPARHGDAGLREIFVDMARRSGPDVFSRQQRAIVGRADSRDHLGAIRCPTWVITGEDDGLIPPALSEEMAQGIPGAKLVRIPNCGHLSALERPEEVAQVFRDAWQA